MKTEDFAKKIFSRYLWVNLLAMGVVLVVMALAIQYLMGIYTHHGESIALPDVRKKSFERATYDLEELGMQIEITDTGYVKNLPPGTILEQMPEPGTHVKSGRIIYLTINALDSPTLSIPDIIDNSSLREATAKLTAMGFNLGATQYVSGEKDWVYGIICNGHNVTNGQRVPKDSKLIIQAGNGQRNAEDSIYMTDAPQRDEFEDIMIDDFEEEIKDNSSNSNSSNAGNGDDFEVVE